MMASVALPATDGRMVDLSTQPGRVVVYAYPRTGRPNTPNPEGWDEIPGARGCSPQSCSFRDHFAELRALAVAAVFGLSTQDTAYQREAAERLRLPFPLLSDDQLRLARAMNLPTFEVEGMTLLKRLTLILNNGRIDHVFYPVFPPDKNATDVMEWLKLHVRSAGEKPSMQEATPHQGKKMRHFVAYHNEKRMGYSAEDSDPQRLYTSKGIASIGDVVWIFAGTGESPKRCTLRSRFVINQISESKNPEFRFAL